MESNLPAPRDEAPLATADEGAAGPSAAEPGRAAVEQNLAAGLIPLAIIALLVLSFVAAAWTFLATLPAS